MQPACLSAFIEGKSGASQQVLDSLILSLLKLVFNIAVEHASNKCTDITPVCLPAKCIAFHTTCLSLALAEGLGPEGL